MAKKATLEKLHKFYLAVKNACKKDFRSAEASEAILNLTASAIQFLARDTELIQLVSRVPGKKYVSYRHGLVVARPVNQSLWLPELSVITRTWDEWQKGKTEGTDLARAMYTIALAPCLAMELFDRQNKKGPATYFECLIGHTFARTLGRNPSKRIKLPIRGKSVPMTMDFLFDFGQGRGALHVPVKMSTRERVVQAWAHQRLLDSAYGVGAYKGVMVLFSETKMNSKNLEVVEICVPDQWLAYQSLLSKLDAIFYFDVPQRYEALSSQFSDIIRVEQFGFFFTRIASILG